MVHGWIQIVKFDKLLTKKDWYKKVTDVNGNFKIHSCVTIQIKNVLTVTL